MASLDIRKTSPSESSAASDVTTDDNPPRSWTQEVMGSFGHGRPPPPTYKIPRKQVNSMLITTPADSGARPLSVVPSVSNGGRSSVVWNNPYSTLHEDRAYEHQRGASPVYSRYTASPVSPREGMERNLETSYHFSGLGRGIGSKRSEGSSVDVAVGDTSRSDSTRAVRQVFIRKESKVDRGPRGIGPEFRMAESPITPVPEAYQTPEVISPININTIPVPKTLSIPNPEHFHYAGQLSPPLQDNNYDARPESYLPPLEPVEPLFTPSHALKKHGDSPLTHTRPQTIRGMDIPEHSLHSPFVHHSPRPVPSNHEGSIHATSAIEGQSGRGEKDGLSRGWDNDPENPLNWNMKKKCYHTLIAILYTFAILFTAAVYLPAYGAIAVHFDVSPTATVVGFMLFTLGMIFGPTLGVILSDLFGRRPVYGLALPISCIFTMGTGLATNLGALLVCRFLAALIASPAVAIGFFTVGDIWAVEKTKLATIVYIFILCGGPCLGPIIGGFAVSYGNWAWSMWLTLIVSGVIYMLSYFMLETHRDRILYLREKRLCRGEPSGESLSAPGGVQGALSGIKRTASKLRRNNVNGTTVSPQGTNIRKPNRLLKIKNGVQITIVRGVRMLLFERIVTIACLSIGFTFGCLFQTLVSIPLVFTKVYNTDLIVSGFAELGLLGGMFLSIMVLIILDLTIHKRAQERVMSGLGGRVAPEEKFQLVLVGSILFPVALFWWAWSAQKQIHWFLPIMAGIALGFSALSVILGLILYLQEIYPSDLFISAISATTILQCLLGAVFPVFTITMYENLSVGWAGSVMAFLSLIFVPCPWILWKWGRDMRAVSKYRVNVFCEKERRNSKSSSHMVV